MKGIQAALGVALGAALGLTGVVAMDSASGQGQSGPAEFTVSEEQLRINQRISQAAVRRSNEALNALAPVRQPGGQQPQGASLDQAGGVQPATGTGWPTESLADGAVTSSKLSPDLRAQVGAPGPTGPAGPAGPAGPQGDAGPAGAVPSAGVATAGAYLGEPIPTVNNETVFSTSDDEPGVSGTGPLVLTERKRILATGYVDVRQSGAGTANARCFLGAAEGGGTASFRMSQNPITNFDGEFARLPLTGFTEQDPGTYDVAILCRGSATTEIEGAALTAIVTDISG